MQTLSAGCRRGDAARRRRFSTAPTRSRGPRLISVIRSHDLVLVDHVRDAGAAAGAQ
jgi:hypothetical protein